MTATVHLRPARPDDAELLGEMLVEAGGGMFEVLLDGVVPGVTPAQMMAEAAREPESGFSYRRTTVVEAGGVPVGSLTAFPADQFGNDTSSLIPAERLIYLQPVRTLLDRGSWYVAAIAIRPEQRGRHLGGRLLQATFAQAHEQGFPRVSLHVWTATWLPSAFTCGSASSRPAARMCRRTRCSGTAPACSRFPGRPSLRRLWTTGSHRQITSGTGLGRVPQNSARASK